MLPIKVEIPQSKDKKPVEPIKLEEMREHEVESDQEELEGFLNNKELEKIKEEFVDIKEFTHSNVDHIRSIVDNVVTRLERDQDQIYEHSRMVVSSVTSDVEAILTKFRKERAEQVSSNN